eukprot:4836528-Prymnesium_polylepis.1
MDQLVGTKPFVSAATVDLEAAVRKVEEGRRRPHWFKQRPRADAARAAVVSGKEAMILPPASLVQYGDIGI